jgi:hypothetical protein
MPCESVVSGSGSYSRVVPSASTSVAMPLPRSTAPRRSWRATVESDKGVVIGVLYLLNGIFRTARCLETSRFELAPHSSFYSCTAVVPAGIISSQINK